MHAQLTITLQVVRVRRDRVHLVKAQSRRNVRVTMVVSEDEAVRTLASSVITTLLLSSLHACASQSICDLLFLSPLFPTSVCTSFFSSCNGWFSLFPDSRMCDLIMCLGRSFYLLRSCTILLLV